MNGVLELLYFPSRAIVGKFGLRRIIVIMCDEIRTQFRQGRVYAEILQFVNTRLLNKSAAQSILLCIVTVLKETFTSRLLGITDTEEGILNMMADTHITILGRFGISIAIKRFAFVMGQARDAKLRMEPLGLCPHLIRVSSDIFLRCAVSFPKQ